MQDSDYENPDEHSDSEMYVLPAEETGDDSYEPPPVEQETRTVHPALPFARGEYVGEALGAQPSGQRGGEGRPRLVGTSQGGIKCAVSHIPSTRQTRGLKAGAGTRRAELA